ncbi:hypothetical protein P13BB106kb_p053 [Pectobacterium phage DU_PP_V]|uniref:Cyclic-phosphate processing Receiver domain-containing protein n=1 Tax=Pectobacterium phage DU_PP_V TaxID=2041492 RepID=A0A2D2W6W3_9CAUD|nr:hypothetical protein HOS40_gp116 [Pectobacterium phage DU_PP_V]ATS94037.1 hypothetical protein P13BB106kb_p053 [Pectobacterium phage DU_PP_V]
METLLWVDDLRDPKDYPIFTKGINHVIWVDNYVDAIRLLQERPYITYVSLDNDLGTEKEGKDVLSFIEEAIFNGQLSSIQKINIHSHNPAAVDSMYGAKGFLESLGITLTKVRA